MPQSDLHARVQALNDRYRHHSAISVLEHALRDPQAGTLALVPAAMLAIPLGSVAGVTPLPGGLGGIEAVLIFVLTPVTSVGAGTVAAAVLLHRAATYWLPLLLGGGSVAALSART